MPVLWSKGYICCSLVSLATPSVPAVERERRRRKKKKKKKKYREKKKKKEKKYGEK